MNLGKRLQEVRQEDNLQPQVIRTHARHMIPLNQTTGDSYT